MSNPKKGHPKQHRDRFYGLVVDGSVRDPVIWDNKPRLWHHYWKIFRGEHTVGVKGSRSRGRVSGTLLLLEHQKGLSCNVRGQRQWWTLSARLGGE